MLLPIYSAIPKDTPCRLNPAAARPGARPQAARDRERRRARRDHVDPRHDRRQRRDQHALARLLDRPGDDPVDRHRLHARARDGDPGHRLGGGSLRHEAALHALHRPVRGRFRALRRRVVGRVADRVPRPAGSRRRHADARRHDDPDPRGRAGPRRPRHGDHRRADAARARSSARSSAAGSSTTSPGAGSSSSTCRSGSRRSRSRCASCRGPAAARRALRRARPRAAVARPRAGDLRPRAVDFGRRLRRPRGLGPGAHRRFVLLIGVRAGTRCARRTR